MRCREARSRIDVSPRGVHWGEDKELSAHLEQCTQCAAYAQAERTLRQVLESARESDTLATTPLAEQRKLVEARLAVGERPRAERRLPARLFQAIRSHRALSAASTAIATALLVVAFVPFSYDRTVGYELAVEGIHKALVDEDNSTICDMLYTLGLIEADVDVQGCDTTCALTVSHLKTRNEAQLVITALTRINPVNLKADVKPVRATTSGSLLERANDELTDGTI